MLDTVLCDECVVLAGQGDGTEGRPENTKGTISVCVHEFMHESGGLRTVQFATATG